MTNMRPLLLLPYFQNNIAMLILTVMFGVAVILSPQECLAFGKHDHGSSSVGSSSISNPYTYHSFNDGDVVVRALQIRGGGGAEGNMNTINKDNDDSDHNHNINIAGITIDDSFRGGQQHQRQRQRLCDGSVTQRRNNLVGRVRRLRDIHLTVNDVKKVFVSTLCIMSGC